MMYRLQITAPQIEGKKNLVFFVEILLNDEIICDIRRQGKGFEIAIFPSKNLKFWSLDLDGFLQAIEDAKNILSNAPED